LQARLPAICHLPYAATSVIRVWAIRVEPESRNSCRKAGMRSGCALIAME
jgi:hypothetical protein